MEFKGTIIHVGQERGGVSKSSGKEWKVQEYVIENNEGTYSHTMVFEVFGEERIAKFGIREGDELTVSFDFDAKKSKDGRWFNSIRAWNVERNEEPETEAPEPQPIVNRNFDDMPF